MYRQLYAVVVRGLFIVQVSYVFCVFSEAEEETLDFVAMLTRCRYGRRGRREICEWISIAGWIKRKILSSRRIGLSGLEAIAEGRSSTFMMDTFVRG